MNTPATLTAIAYAAHRANDRDMKREAIRRLREEFGIDLRFKRPEPTKEARRER